MHLCVICLCAWTRQTLETFRFEDVDIHENKVRFKVVSCIFSKYGHPGKRSWNFFFLFWPKTLARLVLLNEVLTLDSLLISFTTILETFRLEDDNNNVGEI